MAKIGEHDPRWIVEDRPDAVNVNNWHWTERNATPWSKDRLKELLTSLAFENSHGSCRTTEISSIVGEASANNRKSKLIFFYEFVVTIKWTGVTKVDDKVVNGTITIPNLSDENDADEIEVNVALTSDANTQRNAIKELMRTEGRVAIRDQISKYIKALKEEFTQGMILPTKKDTKPAVAAGIRGGVKEDGTPASTAEIAAAAAAATTPSQAKPASSSSSSSSASKTLAAARHAPTASASYRNLEITETFACSPEMLFRALVSEEQVRAYTGSDCQIDAQKGGSFTLFSGNVTGVFKEIEPNRRIVQAWRFKSWTENHFSEVVISLEQKDGSTVLSLKQTGVPTNDYDTTLGGWRSHQFQRMKMMMGFGGPSF